MSYVVHIWEEPSPATWAEADALQARLDGRAAAPNPKFAQLAQGLLQAFPHRRDSLGRSPWIEGAPDGKVDEASWALGVDVTQIDRVMPVLVTQALALGLTVYDGQSGEAYLPGGWRVTPEGREPLDWPVQPDAPTEPDAPDGRGYLEARVRALVLPRLAPRGFSLAWRTGLQTHDMLYLSRQTALGEQRIEMTPESWSDRHWDLWLSCEIEPRLPADLVKWAKPQHTIPLVCADFPDLADFYRNPGVRKPFEAMFRCQGKEQLESFLGRYADWVEGTLLPVLETCADLAGYLKADGHEAGQGVLVKASLAGLALAHCAGDPQLARRAERYGQQRSPYPRPDLFNRGLGELAAFAQYFGIDAEKQR
jgi:hypothetical protein